MRDPPPPPSPPLRRCSASLYLLSFLLRATLLSFPPSSFLYQRYIFLFYAFFKIFYKLFLKIIYNYILYIYFKEYVFNDFYDKPSAL